MSACLVCGTNLDDGEITHHTSYEPEETIPVCQSCHVTIHRTEEYPHLRPDEKEARQFYKRDVVVDKSKIPPRRGWGKTVKAVPCNKDSCQQCPHGLYFYYVRRTDTGVEWQYGGRVTPEMILEQPSITDY